MATRWSDVGYEPVERWARELWLKSDGAASATDSAASNIVNLAT
jgi:hypothetical protein